MFCFFVLFFLRCCCCCFFLGGKGEGVDLCKKNIKLNKRPPLMTLLNALGAYWNGYSTLSFFSILITISSSFSCPPICLSCFFASLEGQI